MGLPEADLTLTHRGNRDGFEQEATKGTKYRGASKWITVDRAKSSIVFLCSLRPAGNAFRAAKCRRGLFGAIFLSEWKFFFLGFLSPPSSRVLLPPRVDSLWALRFFPARSAAS